jgi:hypothetical protein
LLMSKGLVVDSYYWVQPAVDVAEIANVAWGEKGGVGARGVFILNFCQAMWIFADIGG